MVTSEQIERIGVKLGTNFSLALFELVRITSREKLYGNFLSHFEQNPVDTAASRGWMWDDYRSHLNQQVYRRLFLHELEGHPEVTLADLYVPSRAVYLEKSGLEERETDPQNQQKVKVHCFDLYECLTRDWLDLDCEKGGLSRLITGDPGSGKSTFSLMLANRLSLLGWRVLFIPANSIRSLELSLNKIIETHLRLTLRLDGPPNVEKELQDPESTGKPLVIILDGLDEYDVGGSTVSLAAARLVEHALTVVDEWNKHGYAVRLLLCGRPESATSLTAHFRDPFHHLHVTGFVRELGDSEEPADSKSQKNIAVDQRDQWWRKWQVGAKESEVGIPSAIKESFEPGVKEITAQPLLNYMLAVLRLYEPAQLSNLSSLYGALFDRYYQRQKDGKSPAFNKLCPTLDRFRRIMSEIGLAAWHVGDRSVGTDDLRRRFDSPPLKMWFENAGKANAGLSAILSAFYTRPDDAAHPDSGLAHRYVFTHKSFREYLTAVGVVRFLQRLAVQLHPDAEEGWSIASAMRHWGDLFGPTAIDGRQWEFIYAELEASGGTDSQLVDLRDCITLLINEALRGRTPVPPQSESIAHALEFSGNSEEAMILILSAIRRVLFVRSELTGLGDKPDHAIHVSWPTGIELGTAEYSPTALLELLHRLRSRPGSPDEMVVGHISCLFEVGGFALNSQVNTRFRKLDEDYTYASAFDFTGMKLDRSDFTKAFLPYARFHRAQLNQVNLVEADLEGADLAFSSISDCNLSGCNLGGITTDRATINGLSPIRTRVSGAELRHLDTSANVPVFELDDEAAQVLRDMGAFIRDVPSRRPRKRQPKKDKHK